MVSVTVGVPTLLTVPPTPDDPDDEDADRETHGKEYEDNDSDKDYIGHRASRSLATAFRAADGFRYHLTQAGAHRS